MAIMIHMETLGWGPEPQCSREPSLAVRLCGRGIDGNVASLGPGRVAGRKIHIEELALATDRSRPAMDPKAFRVRRRKRQRIGILTVNAVYGGSLIFSHDGFLSLASASKQLQINP